MKYLIILLIFLCSCSSGSDIDPMYCEMVELRKGDPDAGWPDYRGIYEEVCR